MWTGIRWINGPWAGKLGTAARPRGGDWLEEEFANWRRSGVDIVLSLLTPEEEDSLHLHDEARNAQVLGMEFLSLPIPDREVPPSEYAFAQTVDNVHNSLLAGKNVVVHCRQGIGRAGLVAACLLIVSGWDIATALNALSIARGVPVPETEDQRRWIDHFAGSLANAK